jgi:hypothetical protein
MGKGREVSIAVCTGSGMAKSRKIAATVAGVTQRDPDGEKETIEEGTPIDRQT